MSNSKVYFSLIDTKRPALGFCSYKTLAAARNALAQQLTTNPNLKIVKETCWE